MSSGTQAALYTPLAHEGGPVQGLFTSAVQILGQDNVVVTWREVHRSVSHQARSWREIARSEARRRESAIHLEADAGKGLHLRILPCNARATLIFILASFI